MSESGALDNYCFFIVIGLVTEKYRSSVGDISVSLATGICLFCFDFGNYCFLVSVNSAVEFSGNGVAIRYLSPDEFGIAVLVSERRHGHRFCVGKFDAVE